MPTLTRQRLLILNKENVLSPFLNYVMPIQFILTPNYDQEQINGCIAAPKMVSLDTSAFPGNCAARTKSYTALNNDGF
jgi:hypothetical protein